MRREFRRVPGFGLAVLGFVVFGLGVNATVPQVTVRVILIPMRTW